MKTTSGALDTHLQQEVTSLATCWKVVRKDGTVFRFTSNSIDILADFGIGEGLQTYVASSGYNRSNIKSDAEGAVNNMDILGVFDNDAIKEDELRAGLFDGAEVFIFFFNHKDTSQGVLKSLRGVLGEARVIPNGRFFVELRSLDQFFTRRIAELYSKDCRADLGDNRCRLPILPDVLQRDQSVSVGEFYRVRTNPEPDHFECRQLILPFDGDDADTFTTDYSKLANVMTFVGNAQIDTAQSKFGGSSLLLDGTGDEVTTPDKFVFDPQANEPFTIHGWIRPTAIGAIQTMIAHFEESGNQRSWSFRLEADGTIILYYSTDGTALSSVKSVGTVSAVVFTHVAVTRDAAGTIRLFINGVLDANTGTETGAFFNSTAPLRIGRQSTTFSGYFAGHIDELEYVRGEALWTTTFTPPTSGLTIVNPDDSLDITYDMFEDRIYQVTTAGLTSGCQPTYDTVVGNDTTDGTAVLTAEEGWSRAAEVVAVDSTEPRRKFTVTELTPNTGGPRGGFPDDWFNFGAATFETGDNALVSREVKDFVADDGVTIEQDIELFDDMPFSIQVGDKLRVYPGCDKKVTTCGSAKFNNILNFVGEPYVPGTDFYGNYPDAQ